MQAKTTNPKLYVIQDKRHQLPMPQYSKSSYTLTYKPNTKHTLPPTRLFIPLACKQIIPYLYVKLSSWRWTPWFKTCRRQFKY